MPCVERRVDHRARPGEVEPPAEVVAAEADGRDRELGASERVLPHGSQDAAIRYSAGAPAADVAAVRCPTSSSSAAGPARCAGCSRCSAAAGGACRSRRSCCSPALVALAAGAFLFVRSRDDAEDPSRAVAQRFADAWARGDLDGRLAADDRADAGGSSRWRCSRRATARRRARRRSTRGPRRAGAASRADGKRRGAGRGHDAPVRRAARDDRRSRSSGRRDRAAWRGRPTLRLPGLRAGRARAAARAAPAAARVGARRRRAPAQPRARRRRRSPGSLEERYAERLGGRPGAELRFGRRVIAKVDVVPGRSVRTTIRPSLQSAATARARRPASAASPWCARATATCSRSPAWPSPAPSRPGPRSRSSRSPPRSRRA